LEYGFNNPKSAVVLVPVLSSVALKVREAFLTTTLNNQLAACNSDNVHDFLGGPDRIKLVSLHRWHAMGALIQLIASVALLAFHPLFLIPAAVALYHLSISVENTKHNFNDGKFTFCA
jgi:hypothetical protein